MKTSIQTSMVLYENDLQRYCDEYLNSTGIEYFRVPNSFWHWTFKACSVGNGVEAVKQLPESVTEAGGNKTTVVRVQDNGRSRTSNTRRTRRRSINSDLYNIEGVLIGCSKRH